jgi:high-affinity iron transporter
MLTTAIIAFREFLEAFLIVGVFLGISRKLKLKKEKEILLAAGIGILFSLALSTLTYLLGNEARGLLSETNADFLESYLLIFSGLFIAYVVLSLHGLMNRTRGQKMLSAQKNCRGDLLISRFFFLIIFLVAREGFEVALFTASVSLFSAFLQNVYGLLIGFFLASILGVSTYLAYLKVPIHKVFKVTEYAIVLLGASLVQNGITKLFETHFKIDISKYLSLNLHFLPNEETLFGHLLQSLTGIDSDFNLVRLGIMGMYIFILYFAYKKRQYLKVSFKKIISLL